MTMLLFMDLHVRLLTSLLAYPHGTAPINQAINLHFRQSAHIGNSAGGSAVDANRAVLSNRIIK